MRFVCSGHLDIVGETATLPEVRSHAYSSIRFVCHRNPISSTRVQSPSRSALSRDYIMYRRVSSVFSFGSHITATRYIESEVSKKKCTVHHINRYEGADDAAG